MIDEDIQILRVLTDTATSIFLNKKSNIARIYSLDILEEDKQQWVDSVIAPLDISIKRLQIDIYNILSRIPIYNYFLSQQEGLNIFDCAQIISILVDIDNFQGYKQLTSYAGLIPHAENYNKKLHKLLLKIGYKLVQTNTQYQWIFESQIQRYKEQHPSYSNKHIENMAKRIVIRKFLKNLFISWKAINKNFE